LENSNLKNNSPEAKLSVNKLESFFIWLSGVSPKILATCPESEQKKHAALGGTVLIPALLAIVTASFLLYTLNFSVYTIVPVALVWSCMILLMDRALLATYRKGFSFWGKVGQFSIRFAIALLIAVTVAHPVVLLLFSERIDAAYNEGRIKTERNNLAKQCDLKNPQSDIRLFDEKITQFRNELKNSNQLFDPPICTDNTPLSTLADAPTIEKLNQELEVLKAKQIQANQDVALFIENAEKEKQGAAGTGFTGVRGCKKGTQCKKWLSQASDRKDDSIRLGKEIVALEGQISQLNEKIANQLIEVKQASKKQCEKERDELKTIRVKQHDLDQKNLASLREQQDLISRRCAEKDAFITNLKPDVLTQTEILTQLIFPNQGVSWHNLLVFLIFMLLFLAIDMLAVVLKMARVGVYEAKVDMAEGHNKVLEFIHQRHQTVTQFSELASKEQSIIEHLNVNLLKQDLDENFKNLIRSFAQSDRQKLDSFFKD
ncbi:MAG: DUF4407 domain-containing protein, partial [Methylococcaceae bacterium]|nr:DUF4407 domain-containing protein [Methylococcaceae bacterium]